MPAGQFPRPHPVKAVLAERRITLVELSPHVGVNKGTLGRIINGYTAPWPALRRRVAEELDLPESDVWRAS